MPPHYEPNQGSPGGGMETRKDFGQIMPDPGRSALLQSLSVVQEDEPPEEPLPDGNPERQEASFVPTGGGKSRGEALEGVTRILDEFFVANNAAYNPRRGQKHVAAIARDFLEVTGGDAKAAEGLARHMCAEFKKMHDAPPQDRWSGIPLLPLYMAKDAVWAQLSSRVTRIYGTTVSTAPQKSHEQEWREHLAELEMPENGVDAEYVRMGIDPADPHRAARLLAAVAGGNRGRR